MQKKIFTLIGCLLFISALYSQSITVTNPNSASNWCSGKKYTIQWSSNGNLTPNLKINIFKNSISQANFIEQLVVPDTGSKEWTIPNNYSSGTYQIRIKEDKIGTAVYGDSLKFSIKKCYTKFTPSISRELSHVQLQPRPDFEAYGKQLGYIGCDTIKFQVTVKNRGNKDAGNVPIRVTITGPAGSSYSNYTFNSALSCPTLPQNMSCIWSKIFTIKKSGLYRFKFTVNPTLAIKEARFNNNSVEDVIAVQKPDLIVWISPPSKAYLALKSTTVFYVKNQGRGCAGPSILRTYMKQKGVKMHNIPTLKMNEIYKISRTVRWYTLGTKHISGIADFTSSGHGQVDELNENNNKYETSVKCKAATTKFDQSGMAPPPPGFFEGARVINK